MLHDPIAEITCDGEGCIESIFIETTWSTGGYDISDRSEKNQVEDNFWTKDGDKHYCEECTKKLSKKREVNCENLCSK